MKIRLKSIASHLPKIFCALLLLFFILLNPQTASNGIKNGINLLLSTVVPSLFPFLVISSYVASSDSFKILSCFFEKATLKIFKISRDGFMPIVMGLIGGYPVGAKITADLYKNGRLTQNEAERLLYFTVNSGPAFTITAVGLSMLGNYYSGLILYFSNILTALTLGFFCRFLSDNSHPTTEEFNPSGKTYIFINSVSSGSNAIINISAWVLTFACLTEIMNGIIVNEEAKIFLNAIAEVTNGCKICCGVTSLPVISAILGFGGLSVICQVSPYFTCCHVKFRNFFTSRILSASLCAFYCYWLLEFFPKAKEVMIIYSGKATATGITHTMGMALILIIMCIFFVLQVDNRKKVC